MDDKLGWLGSTAVAADVVIRGDWSAMRCLRKQARFCMAKARGSDFGLKKIVTESSSPRPNLFYVFLKPMSLNLKGMQFHKTTDRDALHFSVG